MPSRIIRESCCTSPTLARLSAEAERLWWRLLTRADDWGVFQAEPLVVKGTALPLIETDVESVARWLAELEGTGLVHFYTVGDRRFGMIKSFRTHNRTRARAPKYPLPSADICRHLTADDRLNGDGDGDGNGNGESVASGSGGPGDDSPAWQIARRWMAAIVERHSTNSLRKEETRKRRLPKWAAELDKLHRIDERSWSDIKGLIRFTLDSDFWFPNCQSPTKLRKQWDRLDLERRKSPGRREAYPVESVGWDS